MLKVTILGEMAITPHPKLLAIYENAYRETLTETASGWAQYGEAWVFERWLELADSFVAIFRWETQAEADEFKARLVKLAGTARKMREAAIIERLA